MQQRRLATARPADETDDHTLDPQVEIMMHDMIADARAQAAHPTTAGSAAPVITGEFYLVLIANTAFMRITSGRCDYRCRRVGRQTLGIGL